MRDSGRCNETTSLSETQKNDFFKEKNLKLIFLSFVIIKTCLSVCSRTCVYVSVCVCACVFVCECECVCVCMCVYVCVREKERAITCECVRVKQAWTGSSSGFFAFLDNIF